MQFNLPKCHIKNLFDYGCWSNLDILLYLIVRFGIHHKFPAVTPRPDSYRKILSFLIDINLNESVTVHWIKVPVTKSDLFSNDVQKRPVRYNKHQWSQ